MEQYKKDFIEFMIDCQVLKFGDFVTKSGRKTPFFVNTGFYRTGAQLRKLGEYYAQAIKETFGLEFDVLFGTAYKGKVIIDDTLMAAIKTVRCQISWFYDCFSAGCLLHPAEDFVWYLERQMAVSPNTSYSIWQAYRRPPRKQQPWLFTFWFRFWGRRYLSSRRLTDSSLKPI